MALCTNSCTYEILIRKKINCLFIITTYFTYPLLWENFSRKLIEAEKILGLIWKILSHQHLYIPSGSPNIPRSSYNNYSWYHVMTNDAALLIRKPVKTSFILSLCLHFSPYLCRKHVNCYLCWFFLLFVPGKYRLPKPLQMIMQYVNHVPLLILNLR